MPKPINPYAPSEIPRDPFDFDSPVDVQFVVDLAEVRYAESQYLIHYHPYRLFFGSLGLIILSVSFSIFVTVKLGGFTPLPFFISMMISMIVSSVAYLAMVSRTKTGVRQRLVEHGVVAGVECGVLCSETELILHSPQGEFRWPLSNLNDFRQSRGLILCPEPLFFVFVPKESHFSREDHHSFCKRVRQQIDHQRHEAFRRSI